MTRTQTSHQLNRIASWLVILSPLLLIAGRAPVDLGVSLVAVLFLAHSAMMRDGAWLRERWVQIAFALVAYMCARNLLLEDPGKGFGHGLAWIRFPIYAAALAYWVLPDASVRRRLIYCLTGVLIFLAADGILQYITGTDLFGRKTFYYELAPRLTGPFSDPRLGLMMAWLFLPAAIYLLSITAGQPRSARFMGAALFYCAMLTVIFISAERMAFIFSAFGSLLAFLLLRGLRLQLFVVSIISISMIAACAYEQPGLIGRQYGQTHHEITNFEEGSYGQSFDAGWQLFTLHPVLGVGGKQYQKQCESEVLPTKPDAFCGIHPHNFYLDWLAGYGAIGAGLMLAMIAIWFTKAGRNWQLVRGDAVLGALFIMLIIRFWPIASVPSQFTIWSAYPQWLIVGWFLAQLAASKQAKA